MKSLKELKPLWNLVKEDKKSLILASILIFITELTSIFTGYLNGAAIESITEKLLVEAIIYLSIYFLLRIVVDGIITIKASGMLQKTESKLTRKLGFNTYKKALDLPAYAYEKTSSGEIINRITSDSDTLSFAFEQILESISNLIGSIIIMIYILFNSWIIGLEIVLFMIILYFILKKYNPKMKTVHKRRKEGQDKFTSLTTESIRGIREIKTLGIKDNLILDMKEIIKELFNRSKDEIDIWKKFNLRTRLLRATLEFIVFITCVYLFYKGSITLTFTIAMTYYVYRFMYLIDNINGLAQTYQKVMVSLTRVNEILENRLYKDEAFGDKELQAPKGIIEFKNVSFAYPEEEAILKDFNLTIKPNKKVAIIGKSGQGKTTIFNLLTRIFDPTEGEILLDGVDIKTLTEDNLRKNISIIRQEPFIFNRTIKENFELINPDIKLNEIRKYCKLAYLDDYIMSLEKAYDTMIGEGGINLSGGQKQRLSIARTLAKKSKVILFDEATSALDNNSQSYIKKAIDSLVPSHTVIIVAHRLSTIEDADIIYIVDDGKIVGSGTHKELLKTNEIYKNLYEAES